MLDSSLQLVLKRVVRTVVVSGRHRRPNHADCELLLVLDRTRNLFCVKVDTLWVRCWEGPRIGEDSVSLPVPSEKEENKEKDGRGL